MVEFAQHLKLVELTKQDKEDSLGLVFGVAIACTVDGEPYYDLQGHHVPDDVMLQAAHEFAKSGRSMKVLHEGKEEGVVRMMFPLTSEVAKAFNIQTSYTGLLVALEPSGEESLMKFKDGTLPQLSIAGRGAFEE